MKRYLVRFIKDLVGDSGQQVEVVQRWFEIDADQESVAIEIAIQKFCELEGLKDWTLHADRMLVLESGFPS